MFGVGELYSFKTFSLPQQDIFAVAQKQQSLAKLLSFSNTGVLF